MGISKKCGIKDSMANLKRNDRVSNPLEAPVRDEDEILRRGFECGKTVAELAWGPEIESHMAIGADKKAVRFLQ